MPAQSRLLLASIHDVSPRFEREVSSLLDRLTARLNLPRVAMLVIPDFWGEAPIRGDRRFQARLRLWADQGVEMFLHGWSHRDDMVHGRRLDALRARHLTAREGEFLGMTQGEARRRLRD